MVEERLAAPPVVRAEEETEQNGRVHSHGHRPPGRDTPGVVLARGAAKGRKPNRGLTPAASVVIRKMVAAMESALNRPQG